MTSDVDRYRTSAIQRFAAQSGLEPEELQVATFAVWSNLNPQLATFDRALSVAAAVLQAVRGVSGA